MKDWRGPVKSCNCNCHTVEKNTIIHNVQFDRDVFYSCVIMLTKQSVGGTQ